MNEEKKFTYKVTTEYSKRLVEKQLYTKNIDGVTHSFSKLILWRNGEFGVKLTEKEAQRLGTLEATVETILDDYEWEFYSTWDCCDVDYIEVKPKGTDLEDILVDEDGQLPQEPEDYGWIMDDVQYCLIGPLILEKEWSIEN